MQQLPAAWRGGERALRQQAKGLDAEAGQQGGEMEPADRRQRRPDQSVHIKA
ncbi:hypothetical protein [Bosea sp. TAB14]|uniref:hypothetical protein n=1 Tax=Bosea sp. TAB14 TaxID=3237481 RepID=UPI003F8E4177